MEKPFRFGWENDSDGTEVNLLGGKGAGLSRMSNEGLPVPWGITIPTTACVEWLAMDEFSQKGELREYVKTKVMPLLSDLEEALGGSPLYAVRSGAVFSMPGMMDTILNVGLTTKTVEHYRQSLGDTCALDCQRRLIHMMGASAYGMADSIFKDQLAKMQNYKYGLPEAPGSEQEVLGSIPHLEKLVWYYDDWFTYETGTDFPDTLEDQLVACIGAVFKSWNSPRAIEYRDHHGLPNDVGTAVNIQQMVFGNRDSNSCSGVAFTRNYMTGENKPVGDIVIEGQGEDVVAGTHQTKSLDYLKDWDAVAHGQLLETCTLLEDVYNDMMDLEFTVESGKLWMLQCRAGKRSAKAAFKIAADQVDEGLIDKVTAVSRVTFDQYKALAKVRIKGDTPKPDHTGIAAGGGLVVGHVVTDSEQAKHYGAMQPVILVRDETTPEDFGGMKASVGILTRTGGATSHAAVVGRSMDKHCVVGCTDLPDLQGFPEKITIDGATGNVWLQELPLTTGEIDEVAKRVVDWAVELHADKTCLKIGIDDSDVGGNWVQALDSDIMAFHKWLMNVKADKDFYIEVEAPGCDRRTEDELLWDLVGFDQLANVGAKATIQRLSAFTNVEPNPHAILIYPPNTTGDLTDKIEAKGWRVCRRVQNLEQLLESNDIVEIDPAFASNIGGQQVADKLFEIMAAAGKKVNGKPNPVSKNRLISEVLK